MAKGTIQKLVSKNESAKELYDKSYGYAVFSNIKAAFLITSARGKGVAVHKESDGRVYMKMGSLGAGIGYGLQKMQVVFLFQTKRAFDNFLNSGWRAETAADVAVAKKGATFDIEFKNGIAVFQLTEKGLMAQANLSGSKYSIVKKLNRSVENPYVRNK